MDQGVAGKFISIATLCPDKIGEAAEDQRQQADSEAHHGVTLWRSFAYSAELHVRRKQTTDVGRRALISTLDGTGSQ